MNFMLLQDHGFVQLTSTDKLKAYIQSDPIPYKSPEHSSPGLVRIINAELNL